MALDHDSVRFKVYSDRLAKVNQQPWFDRRSFGSLAPPMTSESSPLRIHK
jgi:hypothetical protein